ncbi:response regulator [Marinagarivorans algicola]|uniref:response regulator n=1 Tax=Marinagarivorans algicola TaxID=1513270 RepID=UPI0006B9BA9E|nr:response regulator [Marinagarivorans algicola]
MSETRATRILLIEDDDDDFVITRDYLEEIPFLKITLVRATNVEDGLKILSDKAYDLCLVDYRLGAMTGIEFIKRAKNSHYTGPIIMLTAQADDQLDQLALGAGAEDYLVKSELTAGRFARTIRYALARQDIDSERLERIKAEQEVRAKDKFLAHLSHELRTPLTAILGYTELLINASEDHHNELSVIHRNGKHLLNLLNDILDISKITANKIELNYIDVNFNGLLTDIYSLMRINALDKGLTLKMHADQPLPKYIKADPTRLRQVLINVISNAIKFTHEGYVDIAILCDQTQVSTQVTFVISDTGIGIEEHKLEKIFKPFVQAADMMTKTIGGSGLGLAISNELIKKMGGSITVNSVIEQGSEFTIAMPVHYDKDIEFIPLEINSRAEYLRNSVTQKSMTGRILIADDLRDIRTLVGHMITQYGPQVTYASNGQDAVNKVLKANESSDEVAFDLILMDIHMPIMDGVSAVKYLRSKEVMTPVVALTAANMKGNKEQLLDSGFNHVLSKPVDTDQLVVTLQEYLQSVPQTHTLSGDHILPCSQESVLIVEDDKDAAEAISALIQSLGHTTHIAFTQGQAIDLIVKTQWSFIFLDLNLGNGSGFEVMDAMQRHKISSRTVLMSGSELSEDEQKKYNFYRILKKPLSLLDIATLLGES